MDTFDSDDDSLDSTDVKDATYKVMNINEITQKMERVIGDVISSTDVIEVILYFSNDSSRLFQFGLNANKYLNFLSSFSVASIDSSHSTQSL